MKTWRLIFSVLVAMLAIQGCSRSASPVPPATVQKDVSQAQQAAAKDSASAARTLAGAEQDETDAAYQASITHAEGQHRIALAKCEALADDRRRACEDQADAELELAKANAKAAKAAHH